MDRRQRGQVEGLGRNRLSLELTDGPVRATTGAVDVKAISERTEDEQCC